MPVVSLEKLKHAVIDGSVGAITVDTSVVERYQFGFESGVLAKLAQFSHAETDHIVLDIVLHEIRSHLRGEADLVRSQVKNALKPLGNSWGIEKTKRDAALTLLFGEQSGEARTEERIQEFLQDSSAVMLTCSDWVSLSDVLTRFIETKAPFGNTEAKKHEFPDAVALLALECDPASDVLGSPHGDARGQLQRLREGPRLNASPQGGLRERHEYEHLCLSQEAGVRKYRGPT